MSYNERRATLKTTNFFAQYPTKTIAEGTEIITWGKQPKNVYFLENGHVRQYDISEKTGQEVTIHIFNPGAFFPLQGTVGGVVKNNYFFYAALTPVVVRAVPAAAVSEFLFDNPDASVLLTNRLLLGLDGLSQRIKLMVFGEARQQVLSELLYLAKHFGEKQNGSILIHHEFTHQQIANLTGLARETVSHVLESAAKEGLVGRDGHLMVIKDVTALTQEIPH